MLHTCSKGAVWGADIPQSIVHFSARYYPLLASRVLVSDMCRLAIASEQFDVVSAIEVIERVSSAEHFLSELVRVMRPDGLCILSTPNHLVVSPGKKGMRSYVQGFTYTTFRSLLDQSFNQVQIYAVFLTKRAYLVRYARRALRFVPPFPFAHIERYLYWHVPPWKSAQVGRRDIIITPHYAPHCFGFLAVCADPRC